MKVLLKEIRRCQICAEALNHEPRPVLSAHKKSKIVIIGQAPGSVVHRTGIPWDDKSGDNLRRWMGVNKNQFYDEKLMAIIPMGFCYPGKGKTGDLPPRKECAPAWHSKLFAHLDHVKLTLLIGKYAQDYYLEKNKLNLTTRVMQYTDYLPKFFVLPHPSPRNNIWMKKNEWFQEDVLPHLKEVVGQIISESK